MSARPPLSIAGRVRRWRVLPGSETRALGVTTTLPLAMDSVRGDLERGDLGRADLEPGDAIWIAPRVLEDRTTPWGLVALLPEPESTRGALVVLSPNLPREGFFARLVGGEHSLPRGLRGSALLLKGFGHIGAGIDPVTGLDLIWGELRSSTTARARGCERSPERP